MTSGLVAYLDGEPVGWCAVEPRPAYTGLVRNNRVPWEGRDEAKDDDSVWAVTCLFTRAGYRKRGVSYELARAAADFARERGARAGGLSDDHQERDPRGAARRHRGRVRRRGLLGGHAARVRRAVVRIDFEKGTHVIERTRSPRPIHAP